jgi:sugar phosphate isomerase/epimerase
MMDVLQASGADYVEFSAGAVSPEEPEERFETLRAAMAPYPLRVETFNSFIPGHYRITGPDVRIERVLGYCEIALRRCQALGGAVVVLGSSGARRRPEGFDAELAERQFIEFCRELGPIASETGIVIAIEPLNRKEDNLLNSVADGIRLVDLVGHPSIQLLADLYHISQEKEPMENVAMAGSRLRHTHCADLGRMAPGFALEGEEDFLGFFRSLRRAGYDARCSFEGILTDIKAQSGPLLRILRQRWAESA